MAGLLSGGSHLSGMFAALAASGFAGIPKPPGDDKAAVSAAAESSSAGASSTSGVQRRRSQRLAKQGTESMSVDNLVSGSEEGAAAAVTNAALNALETKSPLPDPTSSTLPAEPAPSETVVESEQLHADFTDDEDEIDADVFEDDVDPDNPMSDKTITLSVVEGMLLLSYFISILI